MFKKYLLIALLIIFIFILQQSIILNLDPRFNLWPVIFVFTLFTFNEKLALIWTLSSSFLLDLYSPLPFGIYLVIYFIIIFIIYLLAKNFITNRSFLSLIILTLIASLIFNLLMFLCQEIFIWLSNLDRLLIINFQTILIQILSNTIIAVLLYIFTLKFSKKLKANSIITN